MKRTKTHLELSRTNGVLTAIVDARRNGQYTRAKTWDKTNKTDNRANRRTTKTELRNYN